MQEAKAPWSIPDISLARQRTRALTAACLAHALHDGYTDALYAFLPVWQAQFGLSYAGVATLRALYYGTMGGLQVPGDKLVRGLTPRAALVLSTLVAATGFVLMASPLGFAGLCGGLVLAGIGSSIQHPRGPLLVIVKAYAPAARGALGDLSISRAIAARRRSPGSAALLLPILAWRPVVSLMAPLGLGRRAGSC